MPLKHIIVLYLQTFNTQTCILFTSQLKFRNSILPQTSSYLDCAQTRKRVEVNFSKYGSRDLLIYCLF